MKTSINVIESVKNMINTSIDQRETTAGKRSNPDSLSQALRLADRASLPQRRTEKIFPEMKKKMPRARKEAGASKPSEVHDRVGTKHGKNRQKKNNIFLKVCMV